MYEIITRLEDKKTSLSSINEALLLEHGEVESENGNLITTDDSEMDLNLGGSVGIPVTYTVDKIIELVQNNDVVLPEDVLNQMSDNSEVEHFAKMAFDVEDYIYKEQRDDVLEAMIGDIEVTEENVREYIDDILAWNDEDEDEYDLYELREFETRYLGQDIDDYNENAVANPPIVEFRRNIISPINKYMWEKRDEDFTVDEVPLSEAPSLRPLLEENDWDMVDRVYPDADLSLWESPPSNTQTEELKEKTVKRMVEMQGYSEESAEEVSKKVIEPHVKAEEVMG
jgi:predicted Ser/Thr protein kinase